MSVTAHDPLVDEEFKSDFLFSKNLPTASDFDSIIFTVSHDFYKELNIKEWLTGFKGIVVDSNNVLDQDKINVLNKLKTKLIIVGRGDV